MRELIRKNLTEGSEWAIVGNSGNELLWVIVLTGSGAPYGFNAKAGGYMGSLNPKYEKGVLCYGQDYSLVPDHTGPCDVDSGCLFDANDFMLLSEMKSQLSLYLCVVVRDRSDRKAYYNIGSGKVSGVPEGKRAAFGRWSLSLSGDGDGIRVVEFSAKPATASNRSNEDGGGVTIST